MHTFVGGWFWCLYWFHYNGTLSHPFCKFRSTIRVIDDGLWISNVCALLFMLLVTASFSSWSSSSVLLFDSSMHLYGRFLPFWSNSFFVLRPDSFFCCERNIFRSFCLSVGQIFSIILDCCEEFIVSFSHARLWSTTASPIVMGTHIPGEGIKWKLGSFANMRVLVFFFSIPIHFGNTEYTLTGRLLLSSSVHWSFFCLKENKIDNYWLLH